MCEEVAPPPTPPPSVCVYNWSASCRETHRGTLTLLSEQPPPLHSSLREHSRTSFSATERHRHHDKHQDCQLQHWWWQRRWLHQEELLQPVSVCSSRRLYQGQLCQEIWRGCRPRLRCRVRCWRQQLQLQQQQHGWRLWWRLRWRSRWRHGLRCSSHHCCNSQPEPVGPPQPGN